MDQPEIEINVLTLNCWGLGLGISKDRAPRMQSIGEYLAVQDFDVVVLQEVWKHEDFETIRSLVSSVLPFYHFFDNGIIGTGTCMFSKVRINDVTFHHFGLNGYPHRLTHGDWFGGKGLGVGQIDFKGFNIHIFTSHFHATYNYNPLKDIYLGHRVVHGVESAQWIKLSSVSADLTIYAGDFNNEPKDIPYQIVRYVTPLCDAWIQGNGEEGGETNETPANSYTPRSALRDCPDGKRIDYILYKAGPNVDAETISCTLPLPSRVPGKSYSYSDHEAVAAKLLIRRRRDLEKQTSIRDFVRCQSILKGLDTKREVVTSAKQILEASLKETKLAKIGYIIFSTICLLLIVLSFVPPPTQLLIPPIALDLLLFVLRFCLVIALCFSALITIIFARSERNTLRSTITTLDCILESHVADPECDPALLLAHHNNHKNVDLGGSGTPAAGSTNQLLNGDSLQLLIGDDQQLAAASETEGSSKDNLKLPPIISN